MQRAQGGVEALRRQIQRSADRAALEIYAAEVDKEEVCSWYFGALFQPLQDC
jgi:hypothetical protein